MCGFDGILRSKYFGVEPTGRAEVEVRVGKLKNIKVAGKDEVREEIVKGGSDWVLDGFKGCVIWPLRVVLCRKIGEML